MVTWENYEEYMMLYTDDELDEAGVQSLLAFTRQHPELQAELKAYTATKLMPDTGEVYEGKETLLKPVPAKRVISWKPWTMAAAAGVILAIGFSALKWYDRPVVNNSQPEVAVRNIPPLKYQADFPVATHRDTQRKTPVNHKVKALQRSSVMPSPVNRTVIVINKPYESTSLNPAEPEIATIHPAGTHINTAAVPALPAPETVAVVTEIPQPVAQKKHTGLAWLPVSEESKEGISTVGAAINERVAQVKKIRKDLKETSLVVNIGRKEFVINF
ncbi:hypothetical protein ACTHGU_13195 [Chitinophagaceae bacterium MMS25-I14]